jgi:hypothetical protein
MAAYWLAAAWTSAAFLTEITFVAALHFPSNPYETLISSRMRHYDLPISSETSEEFQKFPPDQETIWG